MTRIIKLVLINTLFCILSAFSPIYASTLKSLTFPEKNLRNNLIASNNNVQTVITKGFGSTIDEASQNALKNALKQVVGSFIDSETMFSKKNEISDGIVELSKTITRDTQDYSQGSIRYFEILKTEKRDGIFIVEAKVEVLEGEFSKFIKKFAFAESSFPGVEISTLIETNLNNKKSKAELISNKIIQPLTEGTAYDMKIGDWKFINNWNNFCAGNFYYQNLLNGCGNFENDNVIIATIEVSVNENFLKNATKIFEETKSNVYSLNSNGGFHAMSRSSGKTNDLRILISKPTSSRIYLFKDIKNELGIFKGYPETNSHPIFFSSSSKLKRSKVGLLRYGAPSIALLNSNKQEFFRYTCNAYECPYNSNIKFFRISSGVTPQFSLFGCSDIGTGCIPTVIPNAKFLIMLNFSTEFLKNIKDIKVEYQKQTNY